MRITGRNFGGNFMTKAELSGSGYWRTVKSGSIELRHDWLRVDDPIILALPLSIARRFGVKTRWRTCDPEPTSHEHRVAR